MKLAISTALVLVLACASAPAGAADDTGITRMVLCQDSWFDWSKTEPAKLDAFGKRFRAGFTHKNNDPFAVPNAPVSIMGLRIAQVYPESVGMGVGFSVLVAAGFDKSRAAMEKALGKKLGHCEAGDGMHTCELQIAEKRTVMLMSEDSAQSAQTLVGCYYFYEK